MLSQYEQERADRIAQNQLRLKQLGLHEVREPARLAFAVKGGSRAFWMVGTSGRVGHPVSS